MIKGLKLIIAAAICLFYIHFILKLPGLKLSLLRQQYEKRNIKSKIQYVILLTNNYKHLFIVIRHTSNVRSTTQL